MHSRLQASNPLHRVALALIALALLTRLLVPAGFMPATGQGFAVTICSGNLTSPAWIDASGKLHRGEQQKDHGAEHPCAFAGFGAAFDTASHYTPTLLLLAASLASTLPTLAVAIGRGLAAPPPPSTGPPILR
jgi:hypothetical protein